MVVIYSISLTETVYIVALVELLYVRSIQKVEMLIINMLMQTLGYKIAIKFLKFLSV